MPLEPTPENLLAVASYGIGGRLNQLIEGIRLLDELHGPRRLDADDISTMDTRCKTCRTSSGKPCPWPCVTWLRFAEVLEVRHGVSDSSMKLFHAIGKWRNGGPMPDLLALTSGLDDDRAALGPGPVTR